ncbi:hypothetical protein M8C21_004809 [Ambrosia artemisiifolia]|uniref:Uncharacterized protein n=1 Tax=Ambrosia artemisiifolia TaxID=4212 RepID=A0AAD5D0P0_AMBAR|nr:hypothetical protein M8C21_004809 [Ambrosia artemisiifolia]
MFSKRLLLVFAVLLITSEIATASELASHHESKAEVKHDHDVGRHLTGRGDSNEYETRHRAGPIRGYNLPHGVPCCKT